MSDQARLDETLDVTAAVLMRCFFMGAACMLIWLAAVVTASDWAYAMHSKFIPITRAQFNLIHYAGLISLKTAITGLFLIPYIAIKLVQKKRKDNS